MSYAVLETCIFLPLDLTRSECASWVQAWGSILAIIIAVGIAIVQARRQQQNTLHAIREERRLDLLRAAEAFHVLAQNSLLLQKSIAAKLVSREAVYNAAETGLPFDLPDLLALENWLDGVELHNLPATLIPPALKLASAVRQFRFKVRNVLGAHKDMNADAFQDFFTTIGQMNTSLQETVWEFGNKLNELRAPVVG